MAFTQSLKKDPGSRPSSRDLLVRKNPLNNRKSLFSFVKLTLETQLHQKSRKNQDFKLQRMAQVCSFEVGRENPSLIYKDLNFP